MKKMYRVFTIIMCAVIFTAGLGFWELTAEASTADLRISRATRNLVPGERFNLRIIGTDSSVTWSSSDRNVATVSSNGRVTAVKTGRVTITGRVGGQSFTCEVRVVANRIRVPKSRADAGEQVQLTLLGENTETIRWSSSDRAVATVNARGLVTARAAGQTRITATYGSRSRTITFTVRGSGGSSAATPGTGTGEFRSVNTSVSNMRNIRAVDVVNDITVGLNLGNQFDATGLTWLGANPAVSQMERAWSGAVVTKGFFDLLKAEGFNAVRIPVSWVKASSGAPDYRIRADWMTRIREVVDWAYNNDMYVIINIHHDDDTITLTNSNMTEATNALEKLWAQIAQEFRGYDGRLIFEGLNEPRTKGPNEWNGGLPEYHNNLNILNQLFVDTVRANGGNNAHRLLMVPTYAASAERRAIDGFVLPTDSARNKLIVSVHSYSPWNFALNTNSAQRTWSSANSSDTRDIISMLDRVQTAARGWGVPVIMGEMGAINKNNTAARSAWAEYYVKEARSRGIACFWWDNNSIGVTAWDDPNDWSEHFGLINRSNNTIAFPDVLRALVRGSR